MRSIGRQRGREQLSHRTCPGLGVFTAHVAVPAQPSAWSGTAEPDAPRSADAGVDDRIGVCRGLGGDLHATLPQAAFEDLDQGGGRCGSAVRVEELPTTEGALDREPHRVDGGGTVRVLRGGGTYKIGEFGR